MSALNDSNIWFLVYFIVQCFEKFRTKIDVGETVQKLLFNWNYFSSLDYFHPASRFFDELLIHSQHVAMINCWFSLFLLRWCTWAQVCAVSGRWPACLPRAPVAWGTPSAWWEWQGALLPPSVPSNPHRSCCLRCLWLWLAGEPWVGGSMHSTKMDIMMLCSLMFLYLNCPPKNLLCCKMPTVASQRF